MLLHFVWGIVEAKCISRVSVCVCVCVSLPRCIPTPCTDLDVTWENGRGYPLVVHCWADLQSVHGFRCYDDIVPNANCQRLLVIAICLVILGFQLFGCWVFWVVRYWHGYLCGVRCKWFAYGPTDATATQSSLAPVESRMLCLSGAGLPRLSWKKGR